MRAFRITNVHVNYNLNYQEVASYTNQHLIFWKKFNTTKSKLLVKMETINQFQYNTRDLLGHGAFAMVYKGRYIKVSVDLLFFLLCLSSVSSLFRHHYRFYLHRTCHYVLITIEVTFLIPLLRLSNTSSCLIWWHWHNLLCCHFKNNCTFFHTVEYFDYPTNYNRIFFLNWIHYCDSLP